MTLATLQSVLRYPDCGHDERLEMPTNACAFFHECAGCHTLLRPKAGDCCVCCSYGSVPCPPIQEGATDCCSTGAAANQRGLTSGDARESLCGEKGPRTDASRLGISMMTVPADSPVNVRRTRP